MPELTLQGWLVAFVYAAACETDERTGSNFAAGIRAQMEIYSPRTALAWSLAALQMQVWGLLGQLRSSR